MKSSLEAVANFIGFAIWADGVYDDSEKEAVTEIAEAFGFNVTKFNAVVDVALTRIRPMNEEQVNQFLQKAADDIPDEEIGQVFEACRRAGHGALAGCAPVVRHGEDGAGAGSGSRGINNWEFRWHTDDTDKTR